VHHHVKRGQTLWSISRAYKVDLQTLRRANGLSDTHVLQIGQRLYIPGATQQRQVASRCPCPSRSPQQGSNGAASPISPESEPVPFQWPVQGTITRQFQRRGAQRHDGLDIAAPKGTIIRAVADGKVIFSAWGPGGYGRLVIIRHEAGLVTVYAHNDKNLVHVGQEIKQGKAIATVGRSGRARGYHLHFEIRRKTIPVSPYKFLTRHQRVAQR
jgi:murein DD-endopeptidase MepM/ murein hydrolase activator NlpD